MPPLAFPRDLWSPSPQLTGPGHLGPLPNPIAQQGTSPAAEGAFCWSSAGRGAWSCPSPADATEERTDTKQTVWPTEGAARHQGRASAQRHWGCPPPASWGLAPRVLSLPAQARRGCTYTPGRRAQGPSWAHGTHRHGTALEGTLLKAVRVPGEHRSVACVHGCAKVCTEARTARPEPFSTRCWPEASHNQGPQKSHLQETQEQDPQPAKSTRKMNTPAPELSPPAFTRSES